MCLLHLQRSGSQTPRNVLKPVLSLLQQNLVQTLFQTGNRKREKVFKWKLFLFSNLGYWSPVKASFVPAHLFFCFLLFSLVNLILKVWRNAVIDIERDSDSVMKAKLTHLSTSQRIHSVPALLFSRHIPDEFSLCSIHLKIPPSRHLWKTFVFLELLLLFDFIKQKITKCFVTWGNG